MVLCSSHLATSIPEPKLEEWSLKSGTKCVIAPMPDSQLTCLDFWCRAGSSYEKAGEEGLAHFLEHMVFKGSSTLSAGEFDCQVEALGGTSNAATGFDEVHFYVLVPQRSAQTALELLLSLVLCPSLKPEDYSMEREVVLEEIAQSKDQPDEQVFQSLLGSCWPTHPYGRTILGFESSLKTSSPEQMRAFHSRLYKGSNSCLVISGAIPTEIKDFLSSSRLADINSQPSTDSSPTNLIFRTGKQEIEVPRLESARLLMAWQMPPTKNQEMVIGSDLATSLLAEGRRSRLVSHLREELQIVESVDMDVSILEQGSLVMLEACCMEKHLDEVEKEIHSVLKDCLAAPPTTQETTRAAQLVGNGLCFSLESPSQVAAIAGSQALWDRSQDLLKPLKTIKGWTAKRIQEEILQLLQPELSFTLTARPKEILK